MFLLLSAEAEKLQPIDLRPERRDSVGRSERKRKQERSERGGWSDRFFCFRLLSGAN